MSLEGERAYHEQLYSGKAQTIFAQPAVRAFRQHLVRRILKLTGAGARSRVLSIGCGIGDTEILLAPHVGELTGIDLAQKAVDQARADAARAGVRNATFARGTMEDLPGTGYDVVLAIFFLHHLPDPDLEAMPARVARLLAPGGVFYSLDPSRYRLSGFVGELLIPKVVAQYQSPGERQLRPGAVGASFARGGLETRVSMYDFGSTPMAGLFPGWRAGYTVTRVLDDVLVRVPGLKALSSNFEIVARRGDTLSGARSS